MINEFCFDEITIGQTESFTKEITLEMENAFRDLSGDLNPLHENDAFAFEISGGNFKCHVAFGMLTASLLSTVAGVYMPGKYSLIHSIDNISFKNPVFVGDLLTVTATVKEKQNDLKLLRLTVKMTNQEHEVVLKADMKILVHK